MPTILTNGIQLPDKGSVDWYSSMQSNYNLIDTHLGDTDVHVTAEDKANWDSKQGSLSQAQLDAIAQVATNTDDIATLQSDKANASHTHSSSDITDIDDYATKQYVDNSISGLVDNAPDALNTLNELSAALNDDSNFASTVTTALGNKANSADLATVATSGSYIDLTDKPTINDSTITIQKNGSTVDTFTTNGSNKTINISVPTKTSDITNDSNFVVASSLATVATSGDYDDLSDLPTYGITRYCSSAITDNSSVAFSAISSTNKIKVGDFLLDTVGKMYQISAVDTSNETVSVTTPLNQLAVDSGVMHLSGNETANGEKTFGDVSTFGGSYIGNEASTNARTVQILESNRDTHGQSGIYITKFRQNKPQGGLTGNDVVYLTLDLLENSVRTNTVFRFNFRDFVDNVPQDIAFYPTGLKNSLGGSAGGSSNNKWHLFNGINPGSLSLPDLNNGIDISGYITNFGAGTVNEYTPIADGWISVAISGDSPIFIRVYNDYGFEQIAYSERNEVGGTTGGTYSRYGSIAIPCIKNVKIYIIVSPSTSVLVSAKFYPCQGNV